MIRGIDYDEETHMERGKDCEDIATSQIAVTWKAPGMNLEQPGTAEKSHGREHKNYENRLLLTFLYIANLHRDKLSFQSKWITYSLMHY